MKCIVTGGAGFIGSHIVDSLLVLGDEVIVIENESTRYKIKSWEVLIKNNKYYFLT